MRTGRKSIGTALLAAAASEMGTWARSLNREKTTRWPESSAHATMCSSRFRSRKSLLNPSRVSSRSRKRTSSVLLNTPDGSSGLSIPRMSMGLSLPG